MGKLAQLKLLIWKNLQIQKKHKIGTAFEIGLPIISVVILVIIRHFIKKDVQCDSKFNYHLTNHRKFILCILVKK